MSDRSGDNIYLLVPIILIAALIAASVIRSPSLISVSGLGSAIVVSAPLILATYALMATTLAGRGTIDLAVGPLMALINVSIIQLVASDMVTSPIGVFLLAILIGCTYQLAFALIVIYLRVQPIIVALSGYLALTGINLVIQPRPGGVAPLWMDGWGSGETLFSPVLIIVALATGAWLLFTATTFYSNLRMMGYDERAAYTSGVRVFMLRVGAHLISGVFVALAAICYTALIASGDPGQGATITLQAVTALVLGGIALSGGRGTVIGALLGAVTLFLIGYLLSTFDFGAIQSFVTDLAYGLILVLSLLLTLLVPIIGRHIAFISPYGMSVVLGVIVGGLLLHVATRGQYAQMAAGVAEPGDYFLLAPATVQPMGFGWALGLAIALGLGGLLLRAMVVEARARRLGLFLYIGIALMLMLVFWAARGGVA